MLVDGWGGVSEGVPGAGRAGLAIWLFEGGGVNVD
jgi:hypothetical protein